MKEHQEGKASVLFPSGKKRLKKRALYRMSQKSLSAKREHKFANALAVSIWKKSFLKL